MRRKYFDSNVWLVAHHRIIAMHGNNHDWAAAIIIFLTGYSDRGNVCLTSSNLFRLYTNLKPYGITLQEFVETIKLLKKTGFVHFARKNWEPTMNYNESYEDIAQTIMLNPEGFLIGDFEIEAMAEEVKKEFDERAREIL